MFDILETQKVIEGEARITLIPPKSELLAQLIAAEGQDTPRAKAAVLPPGTASSGASGLGR